MAAFNPYDHKPSRNVNQTAIQQYGANPQPTPAQAAEAIELPVRYVDVAEQAITKMNERKVADRYFKPITSTKLRKLFGLFIDLYNEIKRSDAEMLTEDQLQVLTSARVRIVYECGREESVKTFVRDAKLLEYLKSVGSSRKKLVDYYNYFEALVAYHRYYFGE